MKPEVSIVVPVYNAAAYLEQTVEMVRRQTFSDWELLLVDDGSSDASVRIAEELAKADERIRLFVQKQNGGAAKARNAGIREAAGRYLAFLDADDIWQPQKLERELAFLKEKQAAFVCTSYEFGDEEGNGTGKVVHVPPVLTYRKALSRTVIFTTTVLLDLEKLPGELVRMPDVKSEDTATWWQILRAGYAAYGLDENLAVYRRPRQSLSSNKVEAIRRIWYLYRKQEKLPLVPSIWYFCFWAVRATLRRV